MIFYELSKLYQNLAKQGKLSESGWVDEKVSFGIHLNDKGEIEQLLSLCTEEGRPSMVQVPQHPGRASNICPFFLWDNTGYLLGADSKGKPERSLQCFEASKEKHLKLLEAVDSPASEAVKNYFRTWNPENAQNDSHLQSVWEDLMKNANLVFWYGGSPVISDPKIREAWEMQLHSKEDTVTKICLVTGKRGTVARLHPLIKGVRGAQSSGAALVSFNAVSFNSYGQKNGDNAPTSEEAAKAYGAALNYLLADREHVYLAGDMSVVGWTDNGENGCQDLLLAILNQDDSVRDEDVQSALKRLTRGEPIQWKEQKIDSESQFYVLGLSPNAARLSIRFFLRNQFGIWLSNIREHEERLKIITPAYVTKPYLPFWVILDEMKAPGAKDTIPSLSAAMLRAILENSRYPNELLQCTVKRIRADHDVNWKRMAMLQAYLIRNTFQIKNKEGTLVELQNIKEKTPYLLGRLFAVLERTQADSVEGKLNTSIKDQYLNSFSSTPLLVLARLLKLRESHMRKLKRDKTGLAVIRDKDFMEIMGRIDVDIPRQLSVEEQAVLMLGYYNQTQLFYVKKEEEEKCQK